MKKLFKYALSAAMLFSTAVVMAQNVDVTATAGTPSATYPTLKDAIDAVNAGTHQGSVQVLFTNNTTEVATSILSASGNGAASYSDLLIGVSPSATLPVTVSSSVAAARTLDIAGSNVTVDGRVGQTGTTRSLIFNLTTATTSGLRVIGQSGFPVSNVNLRYVRVQGTGLLHSGSGVFLGTSVQAAPITDVSANDLFVTGVTTGLYVGSAAAPNNTRNASVTNSIFENVNGTNINLNGDNHAQGNLTASNNIIRHVSYNVTANAAQIGIATNGSSAANSSSNVNTITITNNSIENINTNPTTGTPAIRGISIAYSSTGATTGDGAHVLHMYNNNIRLLGSSTTQATLNVGIFFGLAAASAAADARGTFNIAYNTVELGGTVGIGGGSGTTSLSRGVVLSCLSPNTTVNHRNNIYQINRTGGNTRHMFGQFPIPGLDAGSNYIAPPTGFVLNSNFNIYQKPGTANAFLISGPYVGGFIFPAGSTVGTLRDELTDAYGGNQEGNSSQFTVTFPAVTSPEFTASLDKDTRFIGTPIAGVTTDFDGTTRDASFPYIGAHEGSPFPSDLAVGLIYTLGKIPVPYGFPHTVKTSIRNAGVFATTGVTATLTISGANSIVKSVPVPDLNPGQTVEIEFPAILASEITNPNGTQKLKVSITPDDVASNDTASMFQDMSVNTYSLGYRVPPALNPVANGGVGFTGATGDFVAKFLCSEPSEINQARVFFNGAGGINYRLVIFADDSVNGAGVPGTLLYESPTYSSVSAAAAFDSKNISPAVPVNGNFFIGVRQIVTSNVNFSFQNEAPPRSGTFFFTSPQGNTTWTDFATSNSPFRFLIEPRLRAAFDLAPVAVSSPLSSGCFVGPTSLQVQVTNPGNTDADFSVNPMTITVQQTGPVAPRTYNLTVNSGILEKDSTETYTIASIPQAFLADNGSYNFVATINWGPDLIPDNDASPVKTAVVSRASSYPVNIAFTPTGTVNPNQVIDRAPLSAGLNWNFAANQGSPFLAPITGSGVLTTALFNNATAGASARAQLPCLSMPVAAFPVLQFYMSQDPFVGDGTEEDSLRVMFSFDGGVTYNFHSNYARLNPGGTGWRVVKINLPQAPNFRIALDAKRGNSATARDISVHDIQIYDCGTGGRWLASTGDWFDGNNWCSGTAPDATTDVIVDAYAGVANPVIDGQVAQAKTLLLTNLKTLTLTDSSGSGLTVNGNFTFSNNATFTDLGAGQGLKVVGGNIAFSNVPGKSFTVDNFTTDGLVNLNAAAIVNVRKQFNIATGGSVINNGRITLLSDTTAGTANFGTVDQTSSFIGNLSLQRHIKKANALPTGAYHQVAVPFNGQTLGSFTSAIGSRVSVRYANVIVNGDTFLPNIYRYNPLEAPAANNGWVVPTGASESFGPGDGLRLWFRNRFWGPDMNNDGGKYTITGQPYIGDLVKMLSFCPGGCTYTGVDANGYNLIGNPYASALNWDAAKTAATSVDDAIWVWNSATGSYAAYVGGFGSLGQTNIIPSGAGFFVRATAANAGIGFSETHKSTTVTNQFLRTSAVPAFRIIMTGGSVASAMDEAVVAFRPGATVGHDRQYDAAKMAGSFVNVSTLPAPGVNLAINSMPEMTAQPQDLVLVANASAAGNYTLRFAGIQGLDGATMYLKDNLLGTMTPIVEGTTYNFAISTSNPASSAAGRFVITYSNGTVTNLSGAVAARPALAVFPNPSTAGQTLTLQVSNIAAQNATIRVMDALGRTVHTSALNVVGTAVTSHELNANLSSGVYTVAVEGAFGRVIERISIR